MRLEGLESGAKKVSLRMWREWMVEVSSGLMNVFDPKNRQYIFFHAVACSCSPIFVSVL